MWALCGCSRAKDKVIGLSQEHINHACSKSSSCAHAKDANPQIKAHVWASMNIASFLCIQ